jgi:hypothetical protein
MVLFLVIFNEMTINVILVMNFKAIFTETLKSQPQGVDFKMTDTEILTQILGFMMFGLVLSIFTTWFFSRRACFIMGYSGVGAFLFIASDKIINGDC